MSSSVPIMLSCQLFRKVFQSGTGVILRFYVVGFRKQRFVVMVRFTIFTLKKITGNDDELRNSVVLLTLIPSATRIQHQVPFASENMLNDLLGQSADHVRRIVFDLGTVKPAYST